MKNKKIAETEAILTGVAGYRYKIQKNSTKLCLHTIIRNFYCFIEACICCLFSVSEVFILFS